MKNSFLYYKVSERGRDGDGFEWVASVLRQSWRTSASGETLRIHVLFKQSNDSAEEKKT